MAETSTKLSDHFGSNLAQLLADKIKPLHPKFESTSFIGKVDSLVADKSLTQRVEIIADQLHQHFPADYPKAIQILTQIMGPVNPHETGMFTHYYWLMPVGKFIEKYGLDHLDVSLNGIRELTQRNTAEYAIRPFIRKYPETVLQQMKSWATSDSFHLRRLASEGLRPKLPWAAKLDLFIQNPEPVFDILTILQSDPIKFVKKSVANHLTDYLKVNPEPTVALLKRWQQSDNEHTQWIIKHATRKFDF